MSTYYEIFIAASIYAKCDKEVQQYLLFGLILGHKTDRHVILVADQDVFVSGRSLKLKTTKGWHLFVQCKDGKTTWERLSDLNVQVSITQVSTFQARLHPSIEQTSSKIFWFCVSNFAHLQPHIYLPLIGHAYLSCDPILTQKRGIAVPPHHTEHT